MRARRFLALMFKELCERVEGSRGLPALVLVQEWVRRHEQQWKPTWRASWLSSLDIEDEFRRSKAAPPESFERLAGFVSELLLAGTTLETGIDCRRCCCGVFRLLEDAETGEVVSACDFCPAMQNDERIFRPATTERIVRSSYASMLIRP